MNMTANTGEVHMAYSLRRYCNMYYTIMTRQQFQDNTTSHCIHCLVE